MNHKSLCVVIIGVTMHYMPEMIVIFVECNFESHACTIDKQLCGIILHIVLLQNMNKYTRQRRVVTIIISEFHVAHIEKLKLLCTFTFSDMYRHMK